MPPRPSPQESIFRKRGFIPLPRLWIKPADMPKIKKITNKYRDEINSIRAEKTNEYTD
jgi:hypothetical protein